jgi:hypothetical protein
MNPSTKIISLHEPSTLFSIPKSIPLQLHWSQRIKTWVTSRTRVSPQHLRTPSNVFIRNNLFKTLSILRRSTNFPLRIYISRGPCWRNGLLTFSRVKISHQLSLILFTKKNIKEETSAVPVPCNIIFWSEQGSLSSLHAMLLSTASKVVGVPLQQLNCLSCKAWPLLEGREREYSYQLDGSHTGQRIDSFVVVTSSQNQRVIDSLGRQRLAALWMGGL